MICDGCGNTDAYHVRVKMGKSGTSFVCDRCGDLNPVFNPDIYFKEPYTDEHLASDQFPEPKFITSRAEKKMWLEKCNLREAGDRHHGTTNFDPISNRHAIESLRRKGYGR